MVYLRRMTSVLARTSLTQGSVSGTNHRATTGELGHNPPSSPSRDDAENTVRGNVPARIRINKGSTLGGDQGRFRNGDRRSDFAGRLCAQDLLSLYHYYPLLLSLICRGASTLSPLIVTVINFPRGVFKLSLGLLSSWLIHVANRLDQAARLKGVQVEVAPTPLGRPLLRPWRHRGCA